LGLVNEVVPDGRVLDAAIDLAQVVAANAPLAVQASKRVATGMRDGDLPTERDAWRANNDEMMVLFASEDAMEGPMAFAEKREPVWKAR
jgi:crotonobetainyl-CoA hydratase